MSESERLDILVIAGTENRVEAVNSALRNAGIMASCTWAASLKAADEFMQRGQLDLVIAFTKTPREELAKVVKLAHKHVAGLPVLGADNRADEDGINAALASGACDMVSLSQPDRIQRVVLREVQVHRDRKELLVLREESGQMRERVEALMETTVEAIALISEGIIVEANPAFARLFGEEDGDDLIGNPLMDMFDPASHLLLKGALKAQMSGRWSGDALTVTAQGPAPEDADEGDGRFPAELLLGEAEFEDEPCIQVTLTPQLNEVEQVDASAARLDPVTELMNRSAFLETLSERIRDGGHQVMAYLRPEKFGRVVDTLGPLASDAVLAGFARKISEQLEEHDLAGRFGGTMFTVLIKRADMAAAEAWAKGLHDVLTEEVYEAGGRSTTLKVSIGLAEVEHGKDDAEHLLIKAQQANAQAAEDKGPSIVTYVPPETDEEGRLTDEAWVKRIKEAVRQDGFKLHFQSIASMQGAEGERNDVLIRMLDAESGDEIMPGEFLPAAARNKLMIPVDRWVIAQTLKTARKQGEGHSFFVRLSDESLSDESLPPWIGSVIEKLQTPPDAMVIQVSERAAETHTKQTQDLFSLLRQLGCGRALEHFGVGSDPIAMLERFQPDYVKIDGALMGRITADPKAQEKVKELADKSREAGILTVAERVEDANTMAVLWQLGVDFIQGHYVQEPELELTDTV